MAVVTMEQQSKDTRSFYAPQFQIKIENVGLPRNVLRDVVQLTYKDPRRLTPGVFLKLPPVL